MNSNYSNIQRWNQYYDYTLINLLLLSIIFRPALPFLKYPLVIYYFCSLAYLGLKYRKNILKRLGQFLKTYFIVFLLLASIMISILISPKVSQLVVKDILNFIVLLPVLFICGIVVRTKTELSSLIRNLELLIIFFAFVISGYLYVNLIDKYSWVPISPFFKGDFNYDNNFATLSIFFGFFILLTLLIKNENPRRKFIIVPLLILFSLSVFISGSRRGLILLCILIFSLVILQQFRFICKNPKIIEFGSKTLIFVITFLITTALITSIALFSSNKFKNKTLYFLGSDNLLDTKYKITGILWKYSTIFRHDLTFKEVYNKIWKPVFDSNDPESSWGTRLHKTVYPLRGNNVDIVPPSAKGYLVDRNTNALNDLNSEYCDAYSLITQFVVEKDDSCTASVYCYVSEDFDGDLVRLTAGSDCISKKIVYGNTASYYDMTEKGKWKKLDIKFKCNPGAVPIYISVVKNNVVDFSTLKGHVIFAYPQYKKISASENSISANNFQVDTNFEYRKLNFRELSSYNFKKTSNKTSSDLVLGETVRGKIECILDRPECFPLNILSPGKISLVESSVLIDTNFISKWTSRLFSEDTTYYPMRTSLNIDNGGNSFTGGRLQRWKMAVFIFKNEYDFKKKIFGGGFTFLNWYGYYFMGDKTMNDYPHNPFLHVLLYSGILGLILYCFFLYKVFYYYIKYIKQYFLLFSFFLITFYFVFFSSGCPFDPPLMGFLSILPFFIHSVHKKDTEEPAVTIPGQ